MHVVPVNYPESQATGRLFPGTTIARRLFAGYSVIGVVGNVERCITYSRADPGTPLGLCLSQAFWVCPLEKLATVFRTVWHWTLGRLRIFSCYAIRQDKYHGLLRVFLVIIGARDVSKLPADMH